MLQYIIFSNVPYYIQWMKIGLKMHTGKTKFITNIDTTYIDTTCK